MKKQQRLKIALAFMEELEKEGNCADVCPAHTCGKIFGRFEYTHLSTIRDNFCHYLFPELKRESKIEFCGPCPCMEATDRKFRIHLLNLTKAEIIDKVRLLIKKGGLR